VGPGVVPRQSKINNFNCQTDLTAAMGAKDILLCCKTATAACIATKSSLKSMVGVAGLVVICPWH
jgi:hypothetical protein